MMRGVNEPKIKKNKTAYWNADNFAFFWKLFPILPENI
jgi:hypothetical protein